MKQIIQFFLWGESPTLIGCVKNIKKVSSSQAAILLLNWLKHTFSLWVSLKHRSSHWRCSVRKGVVRNLSTFTGKHLCQSLFFDKCAALNPATLIKKETLAQVLSCEFWEISKNAVFTEHLRWLLLNQGKHLFAEALF